MIHKRIDFTKNGGMLFTQDILRRMQDSYADISAMIAQLTDDNMILSGVEPSDNGWSAGWIVYNKELIPFAASSGAYLEFVEEIASVNFKDGFIKPVIFSKYARATNSGNIGSIKMTPSLLSYFMGKKVTGPFKRARSLAQLYADVGRYYDKFKQLEPVYSSRSYNLIDGDTFSFAPDNNGLNAIADYEHVKIEATVHMYGDNGYMNMSNKISQILYLSSFNKINVVCEGLADNLAGFPYTYCELKIYESW